MDFDLGKTLDSIKDGTKEVAEVTHEKTRAFHENYVSKVLPDCGKYGDAAKFVAEMAPGVSEYNAIVDGDWTAFAIAAGIDIGAVAIGAVTFGAGYATVKGGTTVAKTGAKVAVKEVAEAGAKKVVKEVAEESVEKVAKEAAEAGAKKVVKEVAEEGAEKAVKEVAETGTKKVVKEVTEEGAEKTVKETVENSAEKVAKEVTERGSEKIAKDVVSEGTEKATKELAEKTGGSYAEIKKNSDGSIHEIHHMPADSITKFDYADGPAIRMDKMDHRQTASWGSSKEARQYRDIQEKLVSEGKIRDAIQMDIDDIVSKFGNKYDESIKQMLEYCTQRGIF
ncbi:hypothetical protein ACTM97_15745 [Oliverpabstia intestinalis]|uniref:hypothetical protein n=1 Tax=Oliverpabstia intestinalis TaxID=2606633 RepID=UPI003F89AB21